MTPATSAVTAATEVKGSLLPWMSAPDRMIGLSTTMYAIVKKVASPPRISVLAVVSRSVKRK